MESWIAPSADEDVTLSAQIPLIECIRNGTTTVIDHHASPAASATAPWI